MTQTGDRLGRRLVRRLSAAACGLGGSPRPVRSRCSRRGLGLGRGFSAARARAASLAAAPFSGSVTVLAVERPEQQLRHVAHLDASAAGLFLAGR